MAQYKVAPGKSIMIPPKSRKKTASGSLLKPGTILPEGFEPQDVLDRYVESGHIVPMGGPDKGLILPDNIAPVPGAGNGDKDALEEKDMPKVTPREGSLTSGSNGDAGIGQSLNKIQDPVEQVQSPWTYDPAELEDLDIEELHVKILDEDDEYDLSEIDTIEKAVAVLTADFEDEDED